MDSIDRIIVDYLAINCRISLQELSRKTGVSAYDIKKRIDALLMSDMIHNFTTLLSPQLTNEELSIAILDFDKLPKEKDIIESLAKNPSVWKVHRALEDKYVVFSFYFDQNELANLALMFRKLPGIGYVELYSRFSKYWGGKIDLTQVDKQVLRCLVKDARMSVGDIAKSTGLETSAIIESINLMRESEAVLFTIDAADYMKESKIEVIAKVQWNVGKTSQEHVTKWLQDTFSDAYLREYVSVAEPTLFFDFTVNHVQEVELVKRKAMESGLVSKVTPLILFPGTVFTDPRIRKLDEVLTETGFC
ncbi:MAG: AsnC family transcriptional regulator [Candidatus Thorarchaeota archaeon]